MKLFGRFHPQEESLASFSQIKEYTSYILQKECPNCHNNNQLKVLKFERGRNGWEAQIRCDKCLSGGTLNQTGFSFELTDGVEVKK